MSVVCCCKLFMSVVLLSVAIFVSCCSCQLHVLLSVAVFVSCCSCQLLSIVVINCFRNRCSCQLLFLSVVAAVAVVSSCFRKLVVVYVVICFSSAKGKWQENDPCRTADLNGMFEQNKHYNKSTETGGTTNCSKYFIIEQNYVY